MAMFTALDMGSSSPGEARICEAAIVAVADAALITSVSDDTIGGDGLASGSDVVTPEFGLVEVKVLSEDMKASGVFVSFPDVAVMVSPVGATVMVSAPGAIGNAPKRLSGGDAISGFTVPVTGWFIATVVLG